jgi:hypothetical protein
VTIDGALTASDPDGIYAVEFSVISGTEYFEFTETAGIGIKTFETVFLYRAIEN